MASPSPPSSPDLLALPVSDATSSPARPAKRVGMAGATPRRRPRASKAGSGSVQIQDFYISTPPAPRYGARQRSPSRTLALTEDLISPWRIRVRVEAEPEPEADAPPAKRRRKSAASPSPRKLFGANEKTTTVPLKGGEAEGAQTPKRGRGRPRKSNGTPDPRAGTPKVRARKRKSLAEDEQEPGDATEALESVSPAKRKRGRPRKSLQLEDAGGTPGTRLGASRPVLPSDDLPTTGKGRRGRRKSLGPVDIAVDPDADIFGEPTLLTSEGGLGIDIPRQTDRSRSRVQTGALQERSSLSPQKGRPDRSLFGSARKGQGQDPTEFHNEFDSIMESEGFSLITLGSVPSTQQLKSRLRESPESSTEAERSPSPELRNDADEESEPSVNEEYAPSLDDAAVQDFETEDSPEPQPQHTPSFLARTAQFLGFRQRTPSQAATSPAHPSRPAPEAAVSPDAAHVSLEDSPRHRRSTQASLAPQTTVEPELRASTPREIPARHLTRAAIEGSPKERLDDLFSGFGASARRDLRASLRFGEELARRQSAARAADVSVQMIDAEAAEDPRKHLSPAMAPPAARNRQQLPSPEDSLEHADADEMSWRVDTPDRVESIVDQVAAASASSPTRMLQNKIRARTMEEREAEWAEERAAVSRQIAAANNSQVVTVNSDDHTPSGLQAYEDEDEDDDEGDDMPAGPVDDWSDGDEEPLPPGPDRYGDEETQVPHEPSGDYEINSADDPEALEQGELSEDGDEDPLPPGPEYESEDELQSAGDAFHSRAEAEADGIDQHSDFEDGEEDPLPPGPEYYSDDEVQAAEAPVLDPVPLDHAEADIISQQSHLEEDEEDPLLPGPEYDSAEERQAAEQLFPAAGQDEADGISPPSDVEGDEAVPLAPESEHDSDEAQAAEEPPSSPDQDEAEGLSQHSNLEDALVDSAEESEDEEQDELASEPARPPRRSIPRADEETVDIWQLEAQSAPLANHPDTSHAPLPQTAKSPTPKPASAERLKPPRSKLPTPWRSQHDRQIIYSDDADPPSAQSRKHARPAAEASPLPRKKIRVDEEEDDFEPEGLDTLRSSPPKRFSESVVERVRSRLLGEVSAEPPKGLLKVAPTRPAAPARPVPAWQAAAPVRPAAPARSAVSPMRAAPARPVAVSPMRAAPVRPAAPVRSGSASHSAALFKPDSVSHPAAPVRPDSTSHSAVPVRPVAPARPAATSPPAAAVRLAVAPKQLTPMKHAAPARLVMAKPAPLPKPTAWSKPAASAARYYTVPDPLSDSVEPDAQPSIEMDHPTMGQRAAAGYHYEDEEDESEEQYDEDEDEDAYDEPSALPADATYLSQVSYPDVTRSQNTTIVSLAPPLQPSLPSWLSRQAVTSTLSSIGALVPTVTLFSHARPRAASKPKATFARDPSVAPGRSASPAPPLTAHLPWTVTHFRRLDAIYAAGLARQTRFAGLAQRDAGAAALVGKKVRSCGWEKRLEAWECGVVAEFLRALEEEGRWERDGAECIGALEVARRVFGLWCGRVMRGRLGLRDEKVGLWDESLVRFRDGQLRRQGRWREREGTARKGVFW